MNTMKALLFVFSLVVSTEAFSPLFVSRDCAAVTGTATTTRSTSSRIRSSTSSTDGTTDEIGGIVNCHVHLLTMKDVPSGWPPGRLGSFLKYLGTHRYTRWIATNVLPWLDPFRDDDLFERFANLLTMDGQEENFEQLKGWYEESDRFVVLPMDMRTFGGASQNSLLEQHVELARICNKYSGRIIPFVHVDPRYDVDMGESTGHASKSPVEFIEYLHQTGIDGVKFKGIKLYPPLGYDPNDSPSVHEIEINGKIHNLTDDTSKLRDIWRYADEHRLPVIAHCMKSGVWDRSHPTIRPKAMKEKVLHTYTAPYNYVGVLRRYPNMRLCLAHFGGSSEWRKLDGGNGDRPRHTDESYFKHNEQFRELDWASQILEMVENGLFPNLYVDTAYMCFKQDIRDHLRRVLDSNKYHNIRSRVLFGSDYFLSAKEWEAKESNIVKKLKDAFWNTTHFRQIAVTNPKEFLGEDTVS